MLSEFDVDFEGPDFEPETAAPPGVIVIAPLPDGCSYDVSQLPPADLTSLLAECQSEQERNKKIQYDRCLAEMAALIKQAMLAGHIDSAEELLQQVGNLKNYLDDPLTVSPTKPVGKSKSTPRYRDPANPENTWSGRGKRPAWLKTWINVYGEASALEQCLIVKRDELPFANSGGDPE